MIRLRKSALLLLISAVVVTGANRSGVFTGLITDSMCVQDHRMMDVHPDDKCVRECAKSGATARYVLATRDGAYKLSDQETPEKFAGKRVKVTGTLYEKTKVLKVETLTAQ